MQLCRREQVRGTGGLLPGLLQASTVFLPWALPSHSSSSGTSGLGSVPAQHHFSKLRERNSPGEAR